MEEQYYVGTLTAHLKGATVTIKTCPEKLRTAEDEINAFVDLISRENGDICKISYNRACAYPMWR